MGEPREILMVMEGAFGRGWGGATPRLFDLARAFLSCGWHPTLLTSGGGVPVAAREPEKAFPGRVVRTPFSGPYPWFMDRRGLRLVCRRVWSMLGKSNMLDGPERGWGPRVASFCKGKLPVPHPDAVWAITTGDWSGLIAGRDLRALYSCPLILEFQDPCPSPSRPPMAQRDEAVLMSCLAASTTVVTTTARMASHLERHYACCQGKTRVLYLTYDDRAPEAPPANVNGDTLVLLHAGFLHGGNGRNGRTVVRAVAAAYQRRPDLKGKIAFKVFGGGPGGKEAEDLARSLGVSDSLICLPQVGPDEIANEMRRADVLVVIKFPDHRYDMQIPGKLFQYLGAGKPVLGVMGPTEASEIIERSGLGFTVEHDAVDELAGRIIGLWESRTMLGTIYRPNLDFISRFSTKELTAGIRTMLARWK